MQKHVNTNTNVKERHAHTYALLHIHTYIYAFLHIHTYTLLHIHTYASLHIHTYCFIHTYAPEMNAQNGLIVHHPKYTRTVHIQINIILDLHSRAKFKANIRISETPQSTYVI